MCLEIYVHDDSKIVEVWLSNAEKNDPAVQECLKPLYAQYKPLKYTVAVFQSGSRDLYQSTRDLLVYNKLRVAELQVQREKRSVTLEL